MMHTFLRLFLMVTLSFGDVFEWEVETDMEDVGSAKISLEKVLAERGVNVVKALDLGEDYLYLFICEGESVRDIAYVMPPILTFYICRVYIYKDSMGRVRLGYVNAANLIKVFERHLSDRGVRVVREFTNRVITAMEEVRTR